MLFVLVAVSVLLMSVLARSEWRSYQLARMSCEQLMSELKSVSMKGVALVALEYPGPCARRDDLDVWSMVGGWAGLLKMHANTGLLLALAEQAKAWDSQASAVTLDRMKEDVLRMRRATFQSFYDCVLARSLEVSSAHVQHTAKAYYHLTELLTDLYYHSPSRLYTRLDAAIGNA